MEKEDGLISIIGDKYRALILRLVVIHSERVFDEAEVSKTLNIRGQGFKNALQTLLREKILVRKRITKISSPSKGKSVSGFMLNQGYPFISALETLVLNTIPYESRSLFRVLTKMRGMKLVVSTGCFTKNIHAGVDILLVGDGVSEKNLLRMLRSIEKEYGIELNYALYPSNEFMHFLQMRDKDLRNIFDYSHQIHSNTLQSNLL